jgi:hypothetical protein
MTLIVISLSYMRFQSNDVGTEEYVDINIHHLDVSSCCDDATFKAMNCWRCANLRTLRSFPADNAEMDGYI